MEREIQSLNANVSKSIAALRDALKIISLRIDYRKYSKFKFLTPNVAKSMRGVDGTTPDPIIYMDESRRGRATADDVSFCFNFVIDSALVLQEFDFG